MKIINTVDDRYNNTQLSAHEILCREAKRFRELSKKESDDYSKMWDMVVSNVIESIAYIIQGKSGHMFSYDKGKLHCKVLICDNYFGEIHRHAIIKRGRSKKIASIYDVLYLKEETELYDIIQFAILTADDVCTMLEIRRTQDKLEDFENNFWDWLHDRA